MTEDELKAIEARWDFSNSPDPSDYDFIARSVAAQALVDVPTLISEIRRLKGKGS